MECHWILTKFEAHTYTKTYGSGSVFPFFLSVKYDNKNLIKTDLILRKKNVTSKKNIKTKFLAVSPMYLTKWNQFNQTYNVSVSLFYT